MYMTEKVYYDPKHGGCLRIMTRTKPGLSIIKGAYGDDEEHTGYWFAEVSHFRPKKIGNDTYNISVNFLHKLGLTHKPIYHAYMKNREIHWEDGNVWKELYA
jgi:hypothetical protein